jgi:hypothetical protein
VTSYPRAKRGISARKWPNSHFFLVSRQPIRQLADDHQRTSPSSDILAILRKGSDTRLAFPATHNLPPHQPLANHPLQLIPLSTMFRTALRTSAGAAFRQRSVARRYASSHSKQPAGDATWAMGSAAVFGSITAYLLMSGGSPAEAALHSTSHMKIADATEKDVTPEDAPTLVSLGGYGWS